MTSEMYQRTQPQLFNAEMRNYPRSTDSQPSLENQFRDRDGDLTPTRLTKTENGNQNLLPDCQPTLFGGFQLSTDPQQGNRGKHSSLSAAFAPEGGENLPSFRSAFSRDMMGSDAFAPVFSGGKDKFPQRHHSSFREVMGRPLTSSNFATDLGRGQRDMSSTPGDMDVSQRRGRVSLDNVTKRDSKRPSERPRDREYHRRFSVGFQHPHVSPKEEPLGGNTWPREGSSFSPPARSVVAVNFDSQATSPPGRPTPYVQTGAAGRQS